MSVKKDWQFLIHNLEKIKAEKIEMELSENLFYFLVAGEDHRFWSHYGVDPVGLLRAAWKTVFCHHRQGGSTVAMQLVRTVTSRYEINVKRKLKEIYLAVRLTMVLDRSEILKLYLLTAYFGWNMMGIEQACKRLGLNKKNLQDKDAALLIARLKYPESKQHSDTKLQKMNLRATYIIKKTHKLKLGNLHGKPV